jgi:hypothetical protein
MSHNPQDWSQTSRRSIFIQEDHSFYNLPTIFKQESYIQEDQSSYNLQTRIIHTRRSIFIQSSYKHRTRIIQEDQSSYNLQTIRCQKDCKLDNAVAAAKFLY